jgi:hypothetical protein
MNDALIFPVSSILKSQLFYELVAEAPFPEIAQKLEATTHSIYT